MRDHTLNHNREDLDPARCPGCADEAARPGDVSFTPGAQPQEQRITQEQATAMVGRHVLVLLEDVIAAHEKVIADDAKSEVQKDNARLVIAAAKGFGAPLFRVVKVAERPRILRPDRSLRIVR